MSDKPLVSAVIPTYNHGRYVTEAVESALQQTYLNMEVIVVDDGSTDDTRDRLLPYMDRIRYIHQENAGLSAARNSGIEAAKGEWIALLDADDLWHPHKTQVQIAAASTNKDLALIGSPACAKQQFGVMPDQVPLIGFTVRDMMLSLSKGPSGSSALIRPYALEAAGPFDVTLKSIEDRDMWLRISVRFPSAWVDVPCWWYRPHAGQMSRNADRMLANYRRVLENFFVQHADQKHLRPLAMSYMFFDSVRPTLDEGRRFDALFRLGKSVIKRPAGLGDPRMPRWIRARLALRILIGPLRKPIAPPPERSSDMSLLPTQN